MRRQNTTQINQNYLIVALILLFMNISLCLPVSAIGEEIAVVVNLNNPEQTLTSREVSDIFLARRRVFPSSDSPIVVFEQARNSKLREDFFRLLNKMTLRQVNAYWARLQFSGEIQPPESLSDSQEIIRKVQNNPYSIGYVESSNVDNSVKVILELKE